MTGSYTEVQRRAANQIWGAAGHYDFEPILAKRHVQNFLCGGREIAVSRCWMIWPGFI